MNDFVAAAHSSSEVGAMIKQIQFAAAGAAALGVLWTSAGCAKAQAQSGAPAEKPREIQLTVYKEDFALVHEGRPVDLSSGVNRVELDRVSKMLDPATVIFDWKGS